METVLLIGKVILFSFLAMNILAVAVNMADRKANRLPWRMLFETTWRVWAAFVVAGLLIFGLSLVLIGQPA